MAAAAEEEKNAEPEADPLEMAPELDLLQTYGPEWQEKINGEAKW